MDNQRIRITKTMLKDALVRLLKDKKIEKITIYELCDTAQVNRTTFYKYYGSQYELLADIENDLFVSLESSMLKNKNKPQDGLTQVLYYIVDHAEQIKVLLSAVADEQFAHRLFGLPAVQMQFNELFKHNYSEKLSKYLPIFSCNGGYAVIRKWINDGMPERPEEISELIISLCTT